MTSAAVMAPGWGAPCNADWREARGAGVSEEKRSWGTGWVRVEVRVEIRIWVRVWVRVRVTVMARVGIRVGLGLG